MAKGSHVSDSIPTLRVAQYGGGDYVSLAKAVQEARPGTRIFVEAGTYQESLLIDKPLEIVGTGSPHITVQSTKGPCLEIGVDGVTVRGLTFRGFSEAYPTVTLYKNTVLENCDVTSEHTCCVVIGDGAIPTIRRCRIHDGGECGIVLIQQTRAVVEECDIYGHRLHGITVENASPVIQNCRIHGNRECGVQAWENAEVTIEGCEIFDHPLSGVEVSGQAKALLRRCRIHHCEVNALLFWEKAGGIVEDCELYTNRLNGLCLGQGSTPTFRRCKIHECAYGVVVKETGKGVIEDSEVFENAQDGVLVTSGHLAIHRTHIHHQFFGSGISAGAMIGQAKVTVQDCEITDNRAAGVSVDGGGHAVIQGGKITRNERAIEKNFGGRLSVNNCALTGNRFESVHDAENDEVEDDDDVED